MVLTESDQQGVIEDITACLSERGCQISIVSIRHLTELQEEIEDLRKHGLLDDEFYRERLSFFDFKAPNSMPTAQSIIVVAVPRPQTQAIFTWNGQKLKLVIPPTYTAYEKTRDNVEALISTALKKKGYSLERTALPLKLLAVRSGLGQYGRNNICYVPGMGSFHQLVAFYSDLPSKESTRQEKTIMDTCEQCQLCHQACPTGAISSDRFLLHAERCITFLNEKSADVDFPDWLNPSWHNCLVGCLHCQRVCPHNKKFLELVGEKQVFSEEETALLLKVKHGELPARTLTKLDRLSLSDDLPVLRRNLRVLLPTHVSHNGKKGELVVETENENKSRSKQIRKGVE